MKMRRRLIRLTTVTADGNRSDETLYHNLSDALTDLDQAIDVMRWRRTPFWQGSAIIYCDSMICATATMCEVTSEVTQ